MSTDSPPGNVLKAFDPPADQDDFKPGEERQRAAFLAAWSSYIEGSTQVAITGDPFDTVNDRNRSFYFDPLKTPIPAGRRRRRSSGTPSPAAWTSISAPSTRATRTPSS